MLHLDSALMLEGTGVTAQLKSGSWYHMLLGPSYGNKLLSICVVNLNDISIALERAE